jgi:NDP-sugar pyrophosphorylase family protein
MVILCGGLATRLGHHVKAIPKSMIPIEGKPFLEYQIENLKNHSIKDIILCIGHLWDKIENYFGDGSNFGVNIKYNHDGKKLLGPIGAVKNAEHMLDDIFFIMYGDSYLFVNFNRVQSSFIKYDKPGMMVVYKNNNKYDKSNLLVEGNMVVGHKEKHKIKEMNYIDYGTSILRKDVLELVPKNTYYSTETFFSNLIDKRQLLAFEVKERFYHIGNPDALKEFNEYIKNNKLI